MRRKITKGSSRHSMFLAKRVVCRIDNVCGFVAAETIAICSDCYWNSLQQKGYITKKIKFGGRLEAIGLC